MPRAFEYVQQGDELCQQQRLGDAERAFQHAVRAYDKESDTDGLAFALGRMGACYEQSGEVAKAIEVYRRAISFKTDIPAIYYGLIPLLVEQGQLEEAVLVANQWQVYGARHIGGPAHQIFVQIGTQYASQKRYEQAVAILARAVELLDVTRFPEEHWVARGQLGHAYEKAGDVETATGVFAAAISEGSNDRLTYTRYIMHLESIKEYEQALRVIKQGLKVQRDAAWEVDLRKRQQRIEKKAGLVSKGAELDAIPVFSVRRGKKAVFLLHQIKCSPQLSHLVVTEGMAYTTSGGKSPKLSVWRLGDEVALAWRVNLQEVANGVVVTTSSLVTYTQQGRVGEGSATLYFFDLSGNELATQQLPDAVSEVVSDGDQVYAGCRDGHLYAFSALGASLWSYRVPGSREHHESAYMRPCPYYLSPTPNLVAFSSYSSVYALSSRGKLLWHWSVPEKQSVSRSGGIEFTMTTGPASVRGLAAVPEGNRVVATAADVIYELTNGKISRQIERKGKTLGRVFVDPAGALWAIDAGDKVLLIRDCKSAGSFAGPWDTRVDFGANTERIVAWSGKTLLVTSADGKLVAEVESAKTISSAQSLGEGHVVVGAGDLVILDVTSRQSGIVQDKADAHPFPTTAVQTEAGPVQRPTDEQGIPIRWIAGEKLSTERGKARFAGRSGASLTIEQLALEHYGQLGYQGMWSENEYWWAITALLFWDVIFVPLPGVYSPQLGDFPSQLQDMPYDFFTPEFYPKREKLIEQRIADLTRSRLFGLKKSDIAGELKTAFRQHQNKPCRPIVWHRFPKVDSLLLAPQTLTSDQLIQVMLRLLTNFTTNRSGLPDLFLVQAGAVLFAEVKSEKERVASHQYDWMAFLRNEVGVPVEICRVIDGT